MRSVTAPTDIPEVINQGPHTHCLHNCEDK